MGAWEETINFALRWIGAGALALFALVNVSLNWSIFDMALTRSRTPSNLPLMGLSGTCLALILVPVKPWIATTAGLILFVASSEFAGRVRYRPPSSKEDRQDAGA